MSYLLSAPTTALAVGLSTETIEELRPTVLEGSVLGVERLDDRQELLGTVEERADVGCVLVGDETAVDPVATCDVVAEANHRLPVVGVFTDGDETTAHRFLRAGGKDYVPWPACRETLGGTVDRAVTTYEERREEHAQSSMFDSLLSDASIPLYAKDHEARYLRKSIVPADRNPSEVFGKTDPEVYVESPESAAAWYQDDIAVLESEEAIYDKEECYETAEGEYWSRTTKIPWYDDGDLQGLLGISFDITDYVEYRYRLEEYRERFEKFADSVRHDLNNPLQVASGNLELARESGDEEALERAAKALDRIDEMLEDLSEIATEEQQTLSRSRMADSSFESVALQPHRMVDLVTDIWDVLDTGSATLECDLPEGALIYGPESAIRPVLENLLKNSIDHAGADVTIHVGHLPDGGFFVEDDGPGIPGNVRDRIFDSGFTTSAQGSGTGLALVADIAERRGWTVHVTDGSLGGARIEIRNCLFVTSDRLHHPTGPEIDLDDGTAVGEFDVEGGASYDETTDRWTVVGGGMNIWQQTNEFYYVHVALEGPVTIRARVADLEDIGDYSKAGLMVRDSLSADATYGHIGVIPDDRTEVLWRTGHGNDGVSQFVDRDMDSPSAFRVDRVGDTVTVAVSNGSGGWTPVNERQIDLSDPVHVGIVVCSFRPNKPCEAVFEDVSVRRLAVDDD